MDIYYAEIDLLADGRIYEEKLQQIPKLRKERILQYKKEEDKKRSLLAGLLLEYGLNRRGATLLQEGDSCRKVTLMQTEDGKPCIKEEPQLCFNLSHSGKYAAAVFDRCAVGIDIEQLKEAALGRKMADRFFTKEEAAALEEIHADCDAQYAFARLWTRKESYLKALGTGLRLSMDSFSVLGEQVESGERKNGCFLKTWELPDGYCISVCAGEQITAQPVWVDLS